MIHFLYVFRPRNPLCWLDPGAFGTLGVGGGFALGAKLVRPNAEVWIVWGDGSSAYSIAEYDTFKRFKVGFFIIIIFNPNPLTLTEDFCYE